MIDKGSPLRDSTNTTSESDLKRFVDVLEQGTADIAAMKKLALLSREYPARDNLSLSGFSSSMSFPASPTPKGKVPKLGLGEANIWKDEKLFDRLFAGLMEYLSKSKDKVRS